MAWTDRPIKLIRGGSILCEPGWGWDSVTLKDFDLWYVWQGRGWASRGDEKWELSAGSLMCFWPGSCYHARQEPTNRLGVCFFHFEIIDSSGGPIQAPPRSWPHAIGRASEIDLYEQITKHVVDLLQRKSDLANIEGALHLRAILSAMERGTRQVALSRTEREQFDLISSVARYVRENPGIPFTVEALAERISYSTDHFSRLFKQIMQTTPKEFCIQVRLERARSLLQESSMSIEQISMALGYSDPFFFSHQFKKRFGVAPSKWRSKRS